ncbi:hypothetical protein UlMin_006370 [Ulmus minor]
MLRNQIYFFNYAANGQVTGLVAAMMGFSRITPNTVYLGLPLFRSGKIKDFNFLMEQLDNKLAGWKAKTLSKLAKRLVSFWWGHSSNGSLAMCLKAWDTLCKPVSCGGLGFRRLKDFNVALLSKWGWNLVNNEDSFCLSILRARYLRHLEFFEAVPKGGDSCFWKSILATKSLIKEGAYLLVGDGSSIDPWKDPRVPNVVDFRPKLTSVAGVDNTRVTNFFLQ